MRFLLVHDEPLARALIRGVFESAGHACRTAGTLVEAARVLANEHLDGMVFNLELPGDAGMKWLERVSLARPSLARRMVVAAGADLSPADRLRLARIGAILLPKPFSLETLRSIVLDLVPSKERPRRNGLGAPTARRRPGA